MKTTTKILLLLAALLLPASSASAASPPSHTVCGTWARPAFATGCGTVSLTWTPPACSGAGAARSCVVLFTEKWDVNGVGCILSDASEYGNGYGGLCGTIAASVTMGPLRVTYTSIPDAGRTVTVTDTACWSADGGNMQPVNGASTCETWTAGTISLPGAEASP